MPTIQVMERIKPSIAGKLPSSWTHSKYAAFLFLFLFFGLLSIICGCSWEYVLAVEIFKHLPVEK